MGAPPRTWPGQGDGGQAVDVHLGVDGRRVDAAVAKDVGDPLQVGPGPEQPGRG
ncbi:MAG TPA: hypothetical protein VHR66_15130 [Gemmataceae bacterium]|jgi:hypothetical protein|nr:hypothetical protein [Gemmataceae bacterium]